MDVPPARSEIPALPQEIIRRTPEPGMEVTSRPAGEIVRNPDPEPIGRSHELSHGQTRMSPKHVRRSPEPAHRITEPVSDVHHGIHHIEENSHDSTLLGEIFVVILSISVNFSKLVPTFSETGFGSN